MSAAVDKLELAKRLASKITLSKHGCLDTKFATQQAAESILKGSGSQPPITAKTVAEQLAAKLNTKLNYQPKDDDDRMDDENEQTFRKYEEELEINDFPQQARWRVTSKVGKHSFNFQYRLMYFIFKYIKEHLLFCFILRKLYR